MSSITSNAVTQSVPSGGAVTCARVREAITTEVGRILEVSCGNALRAVILTGSLARDEASILEEAGIVRVTGDADVLAVFTEGYKLPDAAESEHIQTLIAESLFSCGIECRVGLSIVHPSFLSNIKPHIFAYELVTNGKIVAGDNHVLSLIRPFEEKDIPLEDAWWTLCNRMIEVLEVVHPVMPLTDPLPEPVQYRCAKLWSDMATSFLLFVGQYASSYRRREDNLVQFAHSHVTDKSMPFSLLEFSSMVKAATSWRMHGCRGDGPVSDCRSLIMTVRCAHDLWRWELKKLAGRDLASDAELWREYMRSLPCSRRLRGWAFVLRKRGWLHSWRHWPRWFALAVVASPRSWAYKVGSELFVRIPELIQMSSSPAEDLTVFHRCLPEVRTGQCDSWGLLASEIAWNYNQFLVGTRA